VCSCTRAARSSFDYQPAQAGKRIETQRLTKDGRLLEVELSVSPIWSVDGKYMGSVGIMRDLTELRQTLDELHSARLEDLERLALVGEYRDDDTNRHTDRVARTASLVAIALGLDADLVRTIRRASPLHDIGKIGIPDCILLKPDRLTMEEFEGSRSSTPSRRSAAAVAPSSIRRSSRRS
jgi:response regulator RpfG family c-di-GMP phosphodiesterase